MFLRQQSQQSQVYDGLPYPTPYPRVWGVNLTRLSAPQSCTYKFKQRVTSSDNNKSFPPNIAQKVGEMGQTHKKRVNSNQIITYRELNQLNSF